MTATMLLAAMLAATPAAPNDYALGQNWLCRPDRRDPCSTVNLDITDVAPDGSLSIRRVARSAEPMADCFYVYPTVSNDPGGNSDMIANDEERWAVAAQFARFGTQCRTFAPLYRQSTLAWLRSNMTGKPIPVDMELRYSDVRDAWRHYLTSDNGGRPFVLVGHSQGSGLLKRLIAEEIEGKPAAAQMLSAMLAGHNVAVAAGKDVGGDFKSTPVCRSASQTGCVIAWASFRASAPPPDNSRYGRPPAPEREVVCANPAKLDGGAAPLQAVFPAIISLGELAGSTQRWTSDNKAVTTPSVALHGLYSGGCATVNGANILSVRLASDPADGRIDDPGGDVRFGQVTAKDWGLHLIDVNLVMQDMVDLVPVQLAAWQAKQAR